MDELEISGKRFISTRRAAKEYKYHSDYIGQLIRGKKLLGRKVGRSWYVELDSLTSYFDKEGATIPKAELVAKAVVETPAPTPTPIEVAAPVQVAAPVVKQYVAPSMMRTAEESAEIIKERNVEFEEIARESIHIPVRVRRPSFEIASIQKAVPLTYLSDDEPMTQRSSRNALPTAMVMPRSQEEAEEMQEESEEYEYIPQAYMTPKKKIGRAFAQIFSIAVLGVVALAVVVGGSVLVSSHTVIEAGKAASVGYSLN